MPTYTHMLFAQSLGVTLPAVNELAHKHSAHADLAAQLGVNTGDVDSFMAGQANANITQALGLPNMAAQEDLATKLLGPTDAAGFVLGYLLAKRQAAK